MMIVIIINMGKQNLILKKNKLRQIGKLDLKKNMKKLLYQLKIKHLKIKKMNDILYNFIVCLYILSVTIN